MKAYLDNNIVSAIAKDDTATESDAIDRLLVARDSGKVTLVTSELTLDEIKNYAGSARKHVERTFRLLEKVPTVRWDELRGMHSYGDARTWLTSPLIQNDPLFDSLQRLGLTPVNAQHVFVAAGQGCSSFLTCDKEIISRASAIQQLCDVTVQRPSQLVDAHAGAQKGQF